MTINIPNESKCLSLGGTWSAKVCRVPIPILSKAEISCESLGGSIWQSNDRLMLDHPLYPGSDYCRIEGSELNRNYFDKVTLQSAKKIESIYKENDLEIISASKLIGRFDSRKEALESFKVRQIQLQPRAKRFLAFSQRKFKKLDLKEGTPEDFGVLEQPDLKKVFFAQRLAKSTEEGEEFFSSLPFQVEGKENKTSKTKEKEKPEPKPKPKPKSKPKPKRRLGADTKKFAPLELE